MEFETNPVLVSQTLQIRLQRPTITAEIGFMLAVTKFFVPTLPLSEAEPRPFHTLDILLDGQLYSADEDLWLCPECRLIADDLTASVYKFDGQVKSLKISLRLLRNGDQTVLSKRCIH